MATAASWASEEKARRLSAVRYGAYGALSSLLPHTQATGFLAGMHPTTGAAERFVSQLPLVGQADEKSRLALKLTRTAQRATEAAQKYGGIFALRKKLSQDAQFQNTLPDLLQSVHAKIERLPGYEMPSWVLSARAVHIKNFVAAVLEVVEEDDNIVMGLNNVVDTMRKTLKIAAKFGEKSMWGGQASGFWLRVLPKVASHSLGVGPQILLVSHFMQHSKAMMDFVQALSKCFLPSDHVINRVLNKMNVVQMTTRMADKFTDATVKKWTHDWVEDNTIKSGVKFALANMLKLLVPQKYRGSAENDPSKDKEEAATIGFLSIFFVYTLLKSIRFDFEPLQPDDLDPDTNEVRVMMEMSTSFERPFPEFKSLDDVLFTLAIHIVSENPYFVTLFASGIRVLEQLEEDEKPPHLV